MSELQMRQNPLRAYRIDRGLSLSELAESASMSRTALAAVEDGGGLLSRDQAIDIAQALRISVDNLAAYLGQPAGQFPA